MSAVLMFKANAIPRSTTRREWRAIDRWRRTVQRELKQHHEVVMAAAMHAAAFGSSAVMLDAIEGRINSRLVTYPDMIDGALGEGGR